MMDKVCDFLGVARIEATLNRELKSAPYVSSLSKKTGSF
jgi:hypothetical protein